MAIEKSEADIKYPNSASLFRFCRRVLDHKYGGVRVIDQDVGQILGFDPADCSHWKKGKKNIRSIQAMKNIAQHLGIDEKLVVDVAAGEMDELEAYYEISGYGAFSVDAKLVETAKKGYYRKNSSSWSKEKEQGFKEQFQPDEEKIRRIVQEIHTRIQFEEPPLYLPEVVASFQDIVLNPVDSVASDDKALPIAITQEGGRLTLSYEKGAEIRPYIRYRLAKAMAQYFLPSEPGAAGELATYAQHMADVEGNLFAAQLLAPAALIRRELKQVDISKDLVAQLAEAFWVSKTFMNRRLRDVLCAE